MAKSLLFSVFKKDLVIQHFKASGPGGQKRNKTSSAVRIIHPESGAMAEGKESRSQRSNRDNALKKLVETKEFKNWHRRKVAELTYNKAELDRRVSEMTRPEKFKIEVIDPTTGRWVEIDN